jgi:1-deoxy-D-xylulose-5-phosphate reductoisomerase
VTLEELHSLTFAPVDHARFPALEIGRDAGRRGPRASAALIAADDVAVDRFLEGSLDFPGIAALCQEAVSRYGDGPPPGLDELLDLDRDVREFARSATMTTHAASGA